MKEEVYSVLLLHLCSHVVTMYATVGGTFYNMQGCMERSSVHKSFMPKHVEVVLIE